jgi:hypothetical protein
MRESIGVHHGALLRTPGDVPAYREDRPNGIGSSSNRIQTAHQKCRVLTEPIHSRMVAYSGNKRVSRLFTATTDGAKRRPLLGSYR